MNDLTINMHEDLSASQRINSKTPFNTPFIAARTFSRASSPIEEADTSPLLQVNARALTGVPTNIEPEFIKEIFARVAGKTGRPRFVIYDSDDEEEDVTEEFVADFNKHYGNTQNEEKAERLIKKMQRIGGLLPDRPVNIHVDIPTARMGLCILAGLNKPEYKMQALNGLLQLLKDDPVTKTSSTQLISLTIKLMQTLDRELIQAETIETQAKIAEAYSMALELIQRHYGKKHINAITDDLKVQLLSTANALKNLNRQDDPKVAFHIQAALEGIRRIVDDERELYDVIDRFYHALVAAGSVLTMPYGGSFESDHFELTFRDLDPHIKGSWYNGMLIFKELGRDALSDQTKLFILQRIVGDAFARYSWKYSYAAMDVLTTITIKGTTENIRRQAFQGIKQLGIDFPGVISFANCNELIPHRDMKQISHFKFPPIKDTNLRVRQGCIENLIKIAEKAPDKAIRMKARQALAVRKNIERDPGLFTLISTAVPGDKEQRHMWIQEGTKS